ncbi:MAG: hypothetical protein JNK27_11040 [Chitinophagaceae bacterium]|nr:hypothetical protein [Chitinophagaceae bacterium]
MKKALNSGIIVALIFGMVSFFSCKRELTADNTEAADDKWKIGANARSVERNYHEQNATVYVFRFTHTSLCPTYGIKGKITVNGVEVLNKDYPDLLAPSPDEVILTIPANADVKVTTDLIGRSSNAVCVWPGEGFFELKRK